MNTTSTNYVTVCTAGKLFFWCVGDYYGDKLFAYGHEPDRFAAECKAWEQAKIHALNSTALWDDIYAERIRTRLYDAEHNATPTGEIVLEAVSHDCDPPVWNIVRKTAKRIFLRRFDGPLAFQNYTVSIDRKTFEETGWASSGRRSFFKKAINAEL